MKTALLRRLVRRAESGAGGITFQVVGYTYLLVILLGLVYDFGTMAFAQTALRTAVVTSAQELARRNVDRTAFLNEQEVRLKQDQLTVGNAQGIADDVVGRSTTLYPPRVTIVNVSMSSDLYRDTVLVEGRTTVNMPVLGNMLGIPPITMVTRAEASPEFGINNTFQ
jgi:Flp pilus assembly protein TadG